MENNITSLFVYGTLRSGFHHPAFEYISKYFSYVGQAKVKGLLYDLGEYPAAIPSIEESFITGELYRAKSPEDFSWAIEQLDTYEGVDSEEGETPLYRREVTEVISDETRTEAWIYWYNKTVSKEKLIPSGDVISLTEQKNKQ